jgi:hypothetical protein
LCPATGGDRGECRRVSSTQLKYEPNVSGHECANHTSAPSRVNLSRVLRFVDSLPNPPFYEGSIPDSSVTVYTGDTGNTFDPKGLVPGSNWPLSRYGHRFESHPSL